MNTEIKLRSIKEILSWLDEAKLAEMEESEFPSLSYEAGVRAALAWVVGEEDEPPLRDKE